MSRVADSDDYGALLAKQGGASASWGGVAEVAKTAEAGRRAT